MSLQRRPIRRCRALHRGILRPFETCALINADGISTGTLVLDLKTVRSVFSNARRQGLVLHNPAEAVELPINSQRHETFLGQKIYARCSALLPMNGRP
jgi:hypothetical protein